MCVAGRDFAGGSRAWVAVNGADREAVERVMSWDVMKVIVSVGFGDSDEEG